MTVDEFRAAVRSWLDARDLTRPADHSMDAQVAHLNRVRRELYDAGWMRYGWPSSVGGLGGPPVLRAVLGEEVANRDLADAGIYSMVEVLVPTMISYAPPELAAEMVPRLLSGREQWCQGFSEPGSGSDLASLSTRALPRGDSWVVTGQKVWTSLAQFAARCVLLTRTAPGHGGITAFFVDMPALPGNTAPGITVRPLRTMHGVDEFAEVFFDDVVVPSSRMLGQPGDGWRLASDLLPYERSTCFWHRIAYLFTRLDRLAASASSPDEAALGAAYLSLYTARCRSRETLRRLDAGGRLGPETSVDKILLQSAEQRLYDTARDLLPGTVELDPDSPWRHEYLYSRAATIYGGTAEIQRNIIARRLLDLGKELTVAASMDPEDLSLLGEAFTKAMASSSGGALHADLIELGWTDMLREMPDAAIPLTFRLLGETGAHAPLLNDVVGFCDPAPLPYAGRTWVIWSPDDAVAGSAVDPSLPLRRVSSGVPLAPAALAAGRRALGWWLLGTGRAMLALARSHAMERVQFGKPIASFQAVRHKLAETLVALDGANAVLAAAGDDGLSSLLAKAAAGQAALTAAQHCQQVMGGIGFTAEHALHHHVKRALVLDGLLGSARELTREAGRVVLAEGSAPRLVDL